MFSVSSLYSVDDRISERRWIGKDLVGSDRSIILRFYCGIGLNGLRKTTKNLDENSRSPGQRIEPGIFRLRSRRVNHSSITLAFLRNTLLSWNISPYFFSRILFIVLTLPYIVIIILHFCSFISSHAQSSPSSFTSFQVYLYIEDNVSHIVHLTVLSYFSLSIFF
jgi:hypothetical protein